MEKLYKQLNNPSLSPYLIVEDVEELVNLLKVMSDATELRRFDRDNGTIGRVELKLDDSVIIISSSTEDYPPKKTMLHFYVPDVYKTFDLAISNGCEIVEKPQNKGNDPDVRGAFYDSAGNYWAVSTQLKIK